MVKISLHYMIILCELPTAGAVRRSQSPPNPQSLYLRTPAHPILHGIMVMGSSPNQLMRDCFLALLVCVSADRKRRLPAAQSQKSSGSAPAKTTSPQDQSKPDEKTPVGGAAAKIADLAKPGAKAPDYTQESFVIEQMHSHYRFEADGTGRKETTARIRVQSEAGVQQWGQLQEGYNSANERVEIPYVRVLKEDGTVVKAGDDAVQDLSAPIEREAPVYTDYRQKHITVPGLRPGEVLEYDMVTVIHTPLAAGQFWADYEFDKSNITLDETLDVDVPAGRSAQAEVQAGHGSQDHRRERAPHLSLVRISSRARRRHQGQG